MIPGIATALVVVALLVWALGRRPDETVEMPRTGRQPARDSVEAALAAGRKIDAIKLYREQHGVGLREAKHAVERLARRGSIS